MSEPDASEPTLEQLFESEVSQDHVHEAARRALAFLATVVDGEISEAKVSDQVQAAKAILDYAVKMPDLLGEVAELAGLASEDDVAVIITALE